MNTITHLAAFTEPDELLKPIAREYPDGYRLAEHWHEGAQLVYAIAGIMELSCEQGVWVISPQQALWIPAKLPHRLRARGRVALRSVYLHTRICSVSFPVAPQSLLVTPLLRELMLRALPVSADTPPRSRELYLMQLLLDEIRWTQTVPLRLSMPLDSRLQKICLSLLQDPGDNRSLKDWGRQVGASTRTLSRLFQTEFGTTFILWRQQARVFAAIPRLNQGETVARVAVDLGYDSAGAFSTAFRRLMGRSPRDYH